MSNQPDMRQLSKIALYKAVAAGLVSLGVPPEVARQITPYIVKAVAVITAFAMLMGIALFAGGLRSDRIARTEAYESIDPEIVEIVRQYSRGNGIPERLLLGVAAAQTNLGSTSPYDALSYTHLTLPTNRIV